jgi:hypothetical protein
MLPEAQQEVLFNRQNLRQLCHLNFPILSYFYMNSFIFSPKLSLFDIYGQRKEAEFPATAHGIMQQCWELLCLIFFLMDILMSTISCLKQWYSFRTVKMLFHCLLDSIVSTEKSTLFYFCTVESNVHFFWLLLIFLSLRCLNIIIWVWFLWHLDCMQFVELEIMNCFHQFCKISYQQFFKCYFCSIHALLSF